MIIARKLTILPITTSTLVKDIAQQLRIDPVPNSDIHRLARGNRADPAQVVVAQFGDETLPRRANAEDILPHHLQKRLNTVLEVRVVLTRPCEEAERSKSGARK